MQIQTTMQLNDAAMHDNLVVVLGNFDGVHMAHQHIIKSAINYACKHDCKVAVVTFEPHPRSYFDRAAPAFRLTSYKEKRSLFEKLGVDILLELPFVKETAELSADAFIQKILCAQLNIKAIVTGYNFHFGHNRRGDSALLYALADKYGFDYLCVEAQHYGDDVISSSSIRKNLREGRPETAKEMLGRYFSIQGEVVHGRALGRTIGFPTANLLPQEYLLPKFGVYAAKSKIESEDIWRDTIVNIGKRPTVQGVRTFIEAHLIDWTGDLYGKNLNAALLSFLRAEMKFDDINALQSQIQKDMLNAQTILNNMKNFSQ